MARRERSVSLDGSMSQEREPVLRYPPGSLRPVANTIRRVYCLEYRAVHPDSPTYGETRMPQWDGGGSRGGSVHRPVWPAAADFLLARGYDPISYVHAMFVHRRGQMTPTPPHIRTPVVEEAYKHYLTHVQDDLTTAWDRFCVAVDGRVRMLRASSPEETETRMYATAISDRQLDLSCLYRYCASVVLNDHQLASHYYEPALMQYAFQKPEYDMAWGTKIPHAMRQAAETYRQRMAD